MYSKGGLATRCDAGHAFLHRGESQVCVYCTLHAGGGACHDHEGHHLQYRNLRKTYRPRVKEVSSSECRIQRLIHPGIRCVLHGECCRGQPPLKICGPDWAVPEGERHQWRSLIPRELDKSGVFMDSLRGASQLDHAVAQGEVPLAFPRPGVSRRQPCSLLVPLLALTP